MTSKKSVKKKKLYDIKIGAIFLTELEARNLGGPVEEVSFTTNASLEGAQLNEDEHRASVTISVEPEKPENIDSPPYVVKVKLTVVYKRKSNEVTPNAMEEFARSNALWHLWPYAREVIADISMRMGYPPLYLPFIPRSQNLPE